MQIVSCLLIGVHSRKEIATILSDVNNETFSETRIKNSLQLLYEKFEYSYPGRLVKIAALLSDITEKDHTELQI